MYILDNLISGSNLICLSWILTKLISFNLLTKVRVFLTYRIMYEDKFVQLLQKIFLGLFISNTVWKTHNECIKSKLSSACFATWSVKPYVSINTLKMIYCFNCDSVMAYGLLFWGHSRDSVRIFRLQKKIVRIMMQCRSSDSCRQFFFLFRNLATPSQLILSLCVCVMI